VRARRAAGTAAGNGSSDPTAARAALAAGVPRPGEQADPAVTAGRTAAALAFAGDTFALPWWLDRQRRPTHAAFVPAGGLGAVENLTGRSWVTLATLTSGPLAVVDPGGAVHPLGSGWSLDWAIGAEDRWHRPAVEPTVRQRVVSHAPVVETACKVPSGDAVARAFAVTTGAGDAVVVEIENESPVPFVAVFALRPTHPLGVGAISTIRHEHPHVLVDERPVLWFDKRPARWSAADAPADALAAALSGAARDDAFEPVRSAVGLATATFLLPVPHRTSVRVVLFPNAGRRDRPVVTSPLPAAGQVARGWEAHVAAAARLELPDRRLSDAYADALRTVAAAAVPVAPAPLGRATWGVADECALVRALSGVGLGGAAAALVRARTDELALDSWFRREPASIERNIEIFSAIGACWEAGRDPGPVEHALGAAVKAAHWTERARTRRAEPFPAEFARWAQAALGSLAAAVRACDQPDVGADLDAFAARFVLDLDDTRPEPLAAEHDDPGSSESPVPISPVVDGPAGVDTAATLRAALDDVAARDQAVFDRVEWLLRAGGTTGRRPSFVHPSLLTGSGGCGDDPLVAALLIDLVRALVVDEALEPGTLTLLPVVPLSWYGQSVDVHDLPTRHGTLSFALRWHATRPALLWELTRRPGDPDTPVRLTVPGLDAAWSSTAASGEALLAAPPHAERAAVVAQPATDHVPMTTLEPRVRREPPSTPPVASGETTAAPLPEPGASFD
jgi:hypothetical protein